jgi:hypothetical protein
MGPETPRQTPEGRLIEEAVKASGRSVRQLAAKAGLSDTRWRQIMRGHQPGHEGKLIPVRAPTATLARMAYVLGITPGALIDVGREDVAVLMKNVGGHLDVTPTALRRAARPTTQRSRSPNRGGRRWSVTPSS